MTQTDPPDTAQTATPDRLAAALHAKGIGCPVYANWRPQEHDADWHDVQAAAAIAADPTLICPDPEAHALADAVREAYERRKDWAIEAMDRLTAALEDNS